MSIYLLVGLNVDIEVKIKEIWFCFFALSLGIFGGIVIKIFGKSKFILFIKNQQKLRTCEKEYLKLKKEQYTEVAMEIQNVIIELGYEECEGSFELSKAWILNNEKLPIPIAFVTAIRELTSYLESWIPIAVSFALGVLIEKVAGNLAYIETIEFWSMVLVILTLGGSIDLMLKLLNVRSEKYQVLILMNMTYAQYVVLIKDKQKN